MNYLQTQNQRSVISFKYPNPRRYTDVISYKRTQNNRKYKKKQQNTRKQQKYSKNNRKYKKIIIKSAKTTKIMNINDNFIQKEHKISQKTTEK